MKTNTKIRWLLLLVTLGLFATSLTARWAATNLVDLHDVASKITKNLGEKEAKIYTYLSNSNDFKSLKYLDKNPELASKTTAYFAEQNIYFQTYKENKLTFWSDNIIKVQNPQKLKQGTSFVKYANGWYEVIKKKDGQFFVLFLIPAKFIFPYKNQYIDNGFGQKSIIDETIDIANLSDFPILDVENRSGRYLFSIKRSKINTSVPFSKVEIILWILGLLTLCLLINSICKYFADKGWPGIASLLLAITLFLLRYLNLKYHFPEALYSLELFNPAIYSSNFYFSSFADLALNTVFWLWIILFIFNYKHQIFKPINKKWVGYSFLIAATILIITVSYLYADIFSDLVLNSIINFKVSNLVNLTWLSFLGIAILMLALLAYYLLIDILVSWSFLIQIRVQNKLLLLVIIFLIFNVYYLFYTHYSIDFILIFILFLIIFWIIYQNNGKINFPVLLLLPFIFAMLVSVKLFVFENKRELEVGKKMLLELQNANDPNAIVLFSEMEKEIPADDILKQQIIAKKFDYQSFISRFDLLYFAGYFNKFEHAVYLFDKNDTPILPIANANLSDYRKLVERSSLKVTDYFYKLNNTFGSQNYFAIIPLKTDNAKIATVLIVLQSKDFEKYGAFPQLMQNGKLDQRADFVSNSYAFYQDNQLINHYGDFVYELNSRDFKSKVGSFISLKKDNFDHLIYQPKANQAIVISQPSGNFWRELAALSFFFILFLIFAFIIRTYKRFIIIWQASHFQFKNLKLHNFIDNNKILYRTRIQIALVLAVVSSLLIIGIITFSYISVQYKEQQQNLIQSKIKVISVALERNIATFLPSWQAQNKNLSFEEFSKMYNTDLNLYGTDGKLLFTTQNKIFSSGLLADRIHPMAFINLNMLQKSEYTQDEYIDLLKFKSAYMPIKNEKNQVLAYLQLPYFYNQDDYNQKIGTFLNLLINIYVLVFVAIGFFAFVVANQITHPLGLIQESIAKTMIGKQNKPIEWKREDEIGSLIREYNAMIETLEDNANKLARSEREMAWREMAKQVAHEIKNPLTPLKLGIQMLDRSWKDKDVLFDEKFQKFSKSFLEQIDSLSRIASEFSDFAKLPELKLEELNLLEVLNKATQLYSQMSHIQIITDDLAIQNFKVIADKDQLLRSFNNLLKNAIESIKDGDEGLIYISGKAIHHQIEITIKDNGVGIPDHLKTRIFVPNFTTKSSGTGLGLAFVKQAIENMGGNIYFTTNVNQGTIFYILLPSVA